MLLCFPGNENPESSLIHGTDPGLQPIRVRTGFIYNLSQATPSSCWEPLAAELRGCYCPILRPVNKCFLCQLNPQCHPLSKDNEVWWCIWTSRLFQWSFDCPHM